MTLAGCQSSAWQGHRVSLPSLSMAWQNGGSHVGQRVCGSRQAAVPSTRQGFQLWACPARGDPALTMMAASPAALGRVACCGGSVLASLGPLRAPPPAHAAASMSRQSCRGSGISYSPAEGAIRTESGRRTDAAILATRSVVALDSSTQSLDTVIECAQMIGSASRGIRELTVNGGSDRPACNAPPNIKKTAS
jgi:hypothetical protein